VPEARRGHLDGGQTALVVNDGQAEVFERELGPEHRREVDGRVGRLPEQEVAEADLARRADQQAGRRRVARVQAPLDEPLVHVGLLDQPPLQARGHVLHGSRHLLPSCWRERPPKTLGSILYHQVVNENCRQFMAIRWLITDNSC